MTKLDSELSAVTQAQGQQRREQTQPQIEQAEYLLDEGVTLQREVARVIEGKREVLAMVDTQNYDFNARYQAKVNEKDTLRQQISEIEHLIRLVRLEIETTQVDTEKTILFAEKETELLNSRQNQERRAVKLIQDDQRDQIRALEEHLTVA